jgi:hypothetical protein
LCSGIRRLNLAAGRKIGIRVSHPELAPGRSHSCLDGDFLTISDLKWANQIAQATVFSNMQSEDVNSRTAQDLRHFDRYAVPAGPRNLHPLMTLRAARAQ